MRTWFILSLALTVALAIPRGGKNQGGGGTGGSVTTTAATTTAATTTAATTTADPDACPSGEADPSQCTGTVADASGLGPYGPDLASSGSSSSISTSSTCGDDARGYFEEYVSDGSRYVIISGAPNHLAECGQSFANPNVRCERWQWIKADETWADTGSTYTAMGTIGFVMSGGVVYDPRSSPDGGLAACDEWVSLDPSYGHSDQNKQYHYHAVPTDYSSAADASACEHIGYMIDGGKLYGYCSVDGVQLKSCYNLLDGIAEGSADHEDDYEYVTSDDCHLDECNMAEINGEMAYVMSAEWPYVPRCLRGNVASINGLTI